MNSLPAVVAQVAALIQQRTGLDVRTQFRADLSTILSEQAREHGARGSSGLDGYLSRLRAASETDAIWQSLIDALTIGETYFMRDPAQFGLLRSNILPTLVEKRTAAGKPYLNLWSAGCATGEEAYSMAITLGEVIPHLEAWAVRLFGTDINARALAFAERATYRGWSFRHSETQQGELRVALRARYFAPQDIESGARWRLRDEIRERVMFRHANLLNGAPLPQLDVIFCRNVLIYIDDAHVERLEDMFFDALAPGGWLFLGHAEALHARRERWLSHIFPGTVVYQKPERRGVTGALKHTERSAALIAPPITETRGAAPADDAGKPTYADAVAALHADDPALAERLLAQVLGAHPSNAQAHALLASLFASRRAHPEAHAHLDAALRLDALLADAHYVRGVVCLEEGDTAEGQKALHQALYCAPDHTLAAFTLAGSLAKTGDLARARREWERARRLAAKLPPDAPVSIFGDLTAGQIVSLAAGYLGD
jgi:chemotaxis protein methyltransferase CheR